MSELTWETLARSLASAGNETESESDTQPQTNPTNNATPANSSPSPQLTPEQRLTLLEMQLAVERVAQKYNLPQDELIKAATEPLSPVERLALQVIGKRSLEKGGSAPEAPPEGGGKASSSAIPPEDEEARLLLEAHKRAMGLNTT